MGLMEVANGRIQNGTLLKGNDQTLKHALSLFQDDPATGQIGELGLGTQVLPFANADIQDEKVLGTMHVATGRDDHLGGKVDAAKFKNKKNATHEDILFAPHKTPEINLSGVWMHKDSQEVLIDALSGGDGTLLHGGIGFDDEHVLTVLTGLHRLLRDDHRVR